MNAATNFSWQTKFFKQKCYCLYPKIVRNVRIKACNFKPKYLRGFRQTVFYFDLNYTPQKSFAPLTLISMDFKLTIPVNSRQRLWSNCSKIVFYTHNCCFYKRQVILRHETIFVQNHMLYPNMQNNHNNVFTIIVWNFIKLPGKLQQLLDIINEKSVTFKKLWLLKSRCVNPPPPST